VNAPVNPPASSPRRLEIQRIEGALGRAEQLPADVAAMIEGAAA